MNAGTDDRTVLTPVGAQGSAQLVTDQQIERAAVQIATAANVDLNEARQALRNAIKIDDDLPFGEYGIHVVYGEIRLTLPNGMRVAVLPDIHVPAHHKRVLWAVFEWLKDWKPDIVIIIGDLCDLFALSHWSRPPHADSDLIGELRKTEELIWTIIELSGCLHVFIIMGNHEDRFARWLSDNNVTALSALTDRQTLAPLLTFHNVLGFTSKDPVTFIYDRGGQGGKGGGILLNHSLVLRHGRAYNRIPSAAARKETELANISTITGDSHTLGMSVRETLSSAVVAVKLGYLCDLEHAYFDYTSDRSRTHLGFGAITIEGGHAYIQPKPIRAYEINGRRKYAFKFGDNLYVEQSR